VRETVGARQENGGTGSALSWGRIRELARKEWRQMFRDPQMTRLIFLSPVVQLIVFGYAVNTDIRHTAMAVVDYDQTPVSRELTEVLTASGYFDIVARPRAAAGLTRLLDRGDVVVSVEIPRGFTRDLSTSQGASVQVMTDGTKTNTSNIARGYVERIVRDFGLRQSGGVQPRGLDFRPQIWYNPDLQSRVYNVPAVAGIIVLLMCLLLTALAVVRERELGTLEQLMVSPLTPAELILGKTLPVALVGFVQLVLVTTVAMGWFGIPMRGSFFLLFVASGCYILAGLGLGLLISTVSSTQQEAFMTMFLAFLPAMLLSGFMFPISSMPRIFQWITYLNPIRYFLEVLRGIFLKGAGPGDIRLQLVMLAVISFGLLFLSARRFRKQIG
jgi:ABC-2 type transport system permease protein